MYMYDIRMETIITRSCGSQNLGAGNQMAILEEQQAHLASKSHPQFIIPLITNKKTKQELCGKPKKVRI